MRFEPRQLQQLFFELVRIDAVSLKERPVADYIGDRLTRLGIAWFEDDAAQKIDGNCGNLIVKKPGRQGGSQPLMLSAHMDSVKSTGLCEPQIHDGLITSGGKTILAADDRAGVAIILHFLEQLVVSGASHRDIEVVFSVAEEIGLLGSAVVEIDKLQSREGYVLDCSRQPGCYVVETPTAIKFKIAFLGKSAHAGVAPEKGVNAISMAIDLLRNIPVGRLDADTVANIGTLSGGDATNVVAAHVFATGEIRSFNEKTIELMQRDIREHAAHTRKKFGGEICLDFHTDFMGFKLDSADLVLCRLAENFKAISLVAEPLRYSGGSDANIYNQKGIKTVTLGIGMQNPHADNECIKLEDMGRICELLQRLFEVTG